MRTYRTMPDDELHDLRWSKHDRIRDLDTMLSDDWLLNIMREKYLRERQQLQQDIADMEVEIRARGDVPYPFDE